MPMLAFYFLQKVLFVVSLKIANAFLIIFNFLCHLLFAGVTNSFNIFLHSEQSGSSLILWGYSWPDYLEIFDFSNLSKIMCSFGFCFLFLFLVIYDSCRSMNLNSCTMWRVLILSKYHIIYQIRVCDSTDGKSDCLFHQKHYTLNHSLLCFF